MYASEVEGQRLTFFVSGKLWGGSLVMGDKETGSEWSHILGKCMAGKLNGKSLTILPATMTTWKAWREQHPETTATMIKPTAERFTKEFLKKPEDYCLALVHQGEARYWRFDLLTSSGVVNDRMGDLDLVVYFDEESKSAGAWQTQEQRTFQRKDGAVVDRETNSIWDLKRGLATDGKLKGTRLRAVSAIVSFTNAWKRFHKRTTMWEPQKSLTQ